MRNYREHMDLGALNLKTRIAYDLDGNPEYVGFAHAGTIDAAAGWMIKKNVYESGRLASSLFAGDRAEFAFVWNDRATYSY